MRRTPAFAALMAAAFVATATPAVADDQPSFSTNPGPAVPGRSVILSMSGGCAGGSAVAGSDAFTGGVRMYTGSGGFYTGTGTVRSDAGAGSYQVTVSCEGGAASMFTMNVAGAVMPYPPNPVRDRGVRAGVGGTQDGGLDPAYVGGGTALILAAGGCAWLKLRRRGQR